jgi:hypothetical protein
MITLAVFTVLVGGGGGVPPPLVPSLPPQAIADRHSRAHSPILSARIETISANLQG